MPKHGYDMFFKCLRYEYMHLIRNGVNKEFAFLKVKEYMREVVEFRCMLVYDSIVELWIKDVLIDELLEDEI